jgi:hypothetical protein
MHSIGPAGVSFCADGGCTSWTTTSVPAVQGGFAMALGSDGAPVYSSVGNAGGLLVTKCDDAACTTAATTTADGASSLGNFNALAIGSDGLPVVSHFDSATSDLRITKCNSRSCR